jgi:hypothetical protein
VKNDLAHHVEIVGTRDDTEPCPVDYLDRVDPNRGCFHRVLASVADR